MDIRLLQGKERFDARVISTVAFHMRMEDPEKARKESEEESEQDWGAFDEDGTLMAHIINNRYRSFLDGTPVRNGGIGAVSTLPEYRRTGAVREIFRILLSHAYEDGEVISTLYPFSHAFYRKFGYETVCWKNIYEFSPAVLEKNYSFDGKAALWKLGDPAAEWTGLYNAFAAGFNLAILRDDRLMEEHLKGEYLRDRKFCYMLREAECPVAYIIFQDARYGSQAVLDVQDLAWSGPEGFRAVLGFLARFSADYGAVRLFLPREIELLSLIRSPRQYDIQKSAEQSYMIRVVNAVKLLETIKKPAGCSFAIRVTDGMISQNNGTWVVTADGVASTDGEPDIETTEKALGQLACGAVSLAEALYREDTVVHRNRETLEKVFIRKPILVEEHF